VDPESQRPLVWRTPVSAIVVGSAGAAGEALVTGPEATSLTLPACGPVKINAGQTAYFRSAYSQPDFNALADHFATLGPADQLGMFYDTSALGQSGAAPMANFLELSRRLTADADPVVWSQLAGLLGGIDDLYANLPERRDAFRAYARSILALVFSRVGWEPASGEANNVAILRETLIDRLGRFEDQGVIAEARRRFSAFVADASSLPAAIRRPTLQVVARNADSGTYDRLMELARKAGSPLEQQQLWNALASAENPDLAARSLDVAISSEVPLTIGLSMVRRVAADNPDLAWRFALDHRDVLDEKLGPMERLGFYPSLVVTSTDPQRLTDLRAFIERNIPENARQSAERSYAELAFRLKIREERLPEVDQWLTVAEAR